MRALAIGCLAVLGVTACVVLALVVTRGGGNSSGQQEMPSPNPTSSSGPSTEPTSTSSPIVAPTTTLPVATPTVVVDEREKRYVAAIARQEAALADSLKELEKLADRPNPLSSDWKRQVAAQLAVWGITLDEATNMNVPDAFKDAHANYVQGLSTGVRGADMVAEGIQRFNVQMVTDAAKVMWGGYETIQQAAGNIHRLAKERGVE